MEQQNSKNRMSMCQVTFLMDFENLEVSDLVGWGDLPGNGNPKHKTDPRIGLSGTSHTISHIFTVLG